MAMMKGAELREKTPEELVKLKSDLLREQFNLRMQKGSGQLNKTHLFKIVRRNIARVETVLNEKNNQGE